MDRTAIIERQGSGQGTAAVIFSGTSRRGPWEGLSDLEPGLRRLLARRCSDENDVDDVIQETYLRAARYRGSVEDPRSLRAWTARIALNVLSDLRRRARRMQPLPAPDEGDDTPLPAALVVEEDDRDVRLGSCLLPAEDAFALVDHALAGLRESDRLLLEHYYRDACGVPECARRLAVPARLVKVRLYRARRRLLERAEWLVASRRAELRLEAVS